MYFSQNAIILVMLVFVTSTVLYTTLEYKTKAIEDEISIKKVSLYEDNIINTLERNIDKIVEDAFINTSYKIMKKRQFFESSEDAVNYIAECIKNEINKTLYCVKENYVNITYNITTPEINPTENPDVVNVKFTVNIEYKKKLNNGELIASKPLIIDKDVKLSRIPDPYVYLNKFYYEWGYYKVINVNNFPNDNKNHTFCIILNNTNFNYNHMYNSSSPREIRIIGWNSTSNKWNVLLPYWVQTWKEGNYETSVIWVRCSRSNINNGQILLLYNSTTKVDRQNPDETFILFDNFNYMNYEKWTVVGGYYINNSILTVQGLGSSVYSNKMYGTGFELVFKGNFTPIHAQSVGFFTPLSDWIGVGWVYKNEWAGNVLYFYNGSGDGYYNAGNESIGNYYIYRMLRNNDGSMYGYIMYDNLTPIKIFDPTSGDYHVSSDTSSYPISINTLSSSDAKVSIDWIFLKDINDITTTVSNEEYTNPDYKEEKPKTFTGTIYYGDPTQYILVNNGSYSIIGLYTNKTDSWGSVGYKPLIEE
ncbi:hypothetical protein JH146_1514 [Methanocaldococcus bathoardescens]|uniref:DUF2341 domain-containing protein n=1 Tax=Methanocaldococcus bathoardescens TaxID=1301915 RepID=A0A076LDQ2_9EURY|nr:DUF2341 domain-containing protein [Methanocaldococcus bathoardescens]AIJ06356.1 hypothetical protein JH146_1514 [Methanocaldococcus bathoardescens]